MQSAIQAKMAVAAAMGINMGSNPLAQLVGVNLPTAPSSTAAPDPNVNIALGLSLGLGPGTAVGMGMGA